MIESLALTTLSWLATYLVHSTLLIGCVWAFTRGCTLDSLTRSLLWKLALVGGLFTATLQTGLGVRPWLGQVAVASEDEAAVGAMRWEARPPGALLGPLALHVGRAADVKKIAGPVAGLAAAVAAGRLAVAWALPDNPGPALHFFLGRDTPRWQHNLEWLADPLHWLWLPTYFALLPVAWALLWRELEPAHRRLGLVALAYFAGLMLVANIYEPRVYGELLVLLYVPAAAALCRWLREAI